MSGGKRCGHRYYNRSCSECVREAQARAIARRQADQRLAAEQQARPEGGPSLRELRDANQERLRVERELDDGGRRE